MHGPAPFRVFPLQPHSQGPCCLASLQGHQVPEQNSQPLLFFSLTETEHHFLLVTYFSALEATYFIPKCVLSSDLWGEVQTQHGHLREPQVKFLSLVTFTG